VGSKRPRGGSWTSEDNLLLLQGMERFFLPSSPTVCTNPWARIKDEFREQLPSHVSNVSIKDRCRNIMEAASRGFSNTRDPSYTPMVRRYAEEILQRGGRALCKERAAQG